MKRIGLYFGSFNPVHTGHLIVAEYFATQRSFEEVWIIVSPHNPLKLPTELAPANQRLEMVKRALEGNPHIKVSSVEFELPQPSFTIDTLRFLKEKFPYNSFTLLLGEDSLAGLKRWKEYEAILRGWPMEIFPRQYKGSPIADDLLNAGNILLVNAPRIEISSTYIRQLIRDGKSTRYLLPESVVSFIEKHRLYL
ncbi:MAG: nicotinate-nucleotide adenylyltransferase [Crocinitomicaceae bacterium]|nr:nicotinate-nucleotide adenylyltransferase [Crocinitomicaceae bacterium]